MSYVDRSFLTSAASSLKCLSAFLSGTVLFGYVAEQLSQQIQSAIQPIAASQVPAKSEEVLAVAADAVFHQFAQNAIFQW